MGNFESISLEDLVFSRSFRNWVLNKESSDKDFWENWIARNPEKAEMLRNAKAVIYALNLNTAILEEEAIDEEVRKALLRLREAPRYLPFDGPDGQPGSRLAWFTRSRRLLVPLVLFSGLCLVGYLFYRTSQYRGVLQSFLASHKSDPVRLQTAGLLSDQTVHLPDGSVVQLTKGSKLYYPAGLARDADPSGHKDLTGGKGVREVFLEGEAFFDIRKNAAWPFYVYTGQVIIKVLGTSFLVRSLPADSVTTVTVRTGQVSVFREDDDYSHPSGGREPAGIILIPNQEAVYDRERDRLHKTLAARPGRLAGLPHDSLVFYGEPISGAFGRLHQLYGIPIVFDEEAVRSCSLTAAVGEKDSFYESLNAICKAIGASYEEIDGNIVVTAAGCK